MRGMARCGRVCQWHGDARSGAARQGITMTIWFTSDTHFDHKNIIKYCNRPFKDIDEMNAELERRWNAVVAPGDRVFHLGDFAFTARRSRILELPGASSGMGAATRKGCLLRRPH